MTKAEFLQSLRDRLSPLPKAETEERLNFYSEMIDDRMEEGLTEEDAVAGIGSVDEIAKQILSEAAPEKIIKSERRKLKTWEIVLLILGSPIWLSLLIAAVSVALSVYAVLWSLIVSVWAVFGAFVGGALGGITASVIVIVKGNLYSGLAIIGAALVCAGLSVFTFYGCRGATHGVILLTKKIFSIFTKKEAK